MCLQSGSGSVRAMALHMQEEAQSRHNNVPPLPEIVRELALHMQAEAQYGTENCPPFAWRALGSPC